MVNEHEAFEYYKKTYKSLLAQRTTADGSGGYGPYSIALAMTHQYGRELKGSLLMQAFQKAKSQFEETATTKSTSNESLISIVSSRKRDASSIKAWEKCMTTKYSEAALFAYGYRDPSGNPYIVVVWAPGSSVVATPVINVKFNVTELDGSIEGAAGFTQVASGSGAAFPVRFSNPENRKAKLDGFAVLVNGEVKGGNGLAYSLTSTAIVPRHLGPIPCNTVFTSNRAYDIGVLNSNTGEMNWDLMTISTGAARPSDAQGVLPATFALTMPFLPRKPPEHGQVTVDGDSMAVVDARGKTVITGQCTGQGVRARLVTVWPGAGTGDVSIRSR